MTTAKELRDDYEKKLKELQENCRHEDVSEWMEHCWTLAHSSGYQVKQCNTCWKIVKYKTKCVACRKDIITDEQIQSYQHDTLCDECLKKGKFYCFEHKKFHDNRQGCPDCLHLFDTIEKNEKEKMKCTSK